MSDCPIEARSLEALPEAIVAHHIPGRLRLKIPGLKGNSDAMGKVRESLNGMPGVRDITFNPVTGSVLVTYDEAHHQTVHESVRSRTQKHFHYHPPPKVGSVSATVELIEGEAEFLAEHSHAARVIVNFCRDVDDVVKKASGNAVDLKVLLPLGLAVITFLEIGATAATPVWMTLGLFSLNHFVELHAHDADGDEDEDEDSEGATPPPTAAG